MPRNVPFRKIMLPNNVIAKEVVFKIHGWGIIRFTDFMRMKINKERFLHHSLTVTLIEAI